MLSRASTTSRSVGHAAGLSTVGRRPDLLQCRPQHAAALGHLQNRLLNGLHLVGIAELAGRFFRIRRLVANHQGLRGFPGRVADHGINSHRRGNDHGRQEPPLHVDAKQMEHVR